jgi:hypothetical protein
LHDYAQCLAGICLCCWSPDLRSRLLHVEYKQIDSPLF